MLKRPALWLIRAYKLAISPLLPPSCRFYPSCSEYTYEAIEVWGVWKGARMGIWRVMRCNPFVKGGYDPVPLPPDHPDYQAQQQALHAHTHQH